MQRSTINQSAVLLGALAVTAALASAMGVMMTSNKPLLALLAGLAAAGLVAGLASNLAAFCLLITIASLDGIVKGAFPGMLGIILKDILVGWMVVRWLWEGLNGTPRPSLSHRMALPTFLFVVYCVAQMFNSETGSLLLAVAGLRSWIGSLALFFVTYDCLTTARSARFVGWYIVALGAMTSLYGVIQQQIGFDHLSALGSGFDFYRKFGERAASTYVAPGIFGLAVGMTAVLALGVGMSGRYRAAAIPVAALCSGLCIMGEFSSGSRGPLIAMVIGLTALVGFSRRPILVFALGLALMVGLLQSRQYLSVLMEARFNSERMGTASIFSRGMFPFHQGWDAMVAHPLGTGVASGVGTGRAFAYLGADTTVSRTSALGFVENELGRAMRELGFPGATLYIWFLWTAATTSFRGWRGSSGEIRWLAISMFAAILGSLSNLAIGQVLYLSPSGIIFWYACAAASRSPQYSEEMAELEREEAEADQRTQEQIAEWNALQRRTPGRAMPPRAPVGKTPAAGMGTPPPNREGR